MKMYQGMHLEMIPSRVNYLLNSQGSNKKSLWIGEVPMEQLDLRPSHTAARPGLQFTCPSWGSGFRFWGVGWCLTPYLSASFTFLSLSPSPPGRGLRSPPSLGSRLTVTPVMLASLTLGTLMVGWLGTLSPIYPARRRRIHGWKDTLLPDYH